MKKLVLTFIRVLKEHSFPIGGHWFTKENKTMINTYNVNSDVHAGLRTQDIA